MPINLVLFEHIATPITRKEYHVCFLTTHLQLQLVLYCNYCSKDGWPCPFCCHRLYRMFSQDVCAIVFYFDWLFMTLQLQLRTGIAIIHDIRAILTIPVHNVRTVLIAVYLCIKPVVVVVCVLLRREIVGRSFDIALYSSRESFRNQICSSTHVVFVRS